jgi:oxygen-independent coproporphyrinogen-3 oxidase
MQSDNLLSVYIHIPFCKTRCGYCDFNTYAGYDHLKDAYIKEVVEEISTSSKRVENDNLIHTIYFGGGTPNLMSAEQIAEIIKSIKDNFKIASNIEISTEANPSCISEDYLKRLRDIGINRLSLGVQSASAKDLEILGRIHTFQNVESTVENAKKAGISNINLDLIFGIPYQTLISFEDTLKSVLNLSPSHLSLYALTVEDSTPLANQIAKKLLSKPDDDLAADMYIMAMEFLGKHKFHQYEISNWSLDSKSQCLHNLQYWRNLNYLGFGAGAHSHYRQTRWENRKSITEYIESVSERPQIPICVSPAGTNIISLTSRDEISETMMMGMRLTEEGINEENFMIRFGINLDVLYSKEITILLSQNLIEWIYIKGVRHLRLTQKGRLLGNQVFMQFILD